MKTLELFNAVIAKPSNKAPFVSKNGLVIESDAVWAKDAITRYYGKNLLDGYGLNKTMHKSWLTIKSSSRESLMMEQIRHYISTYGSNFKDEIYIPEEVLNVPDTTLVFKVIKAYSKEELTKKALDLLKSGIALKEETIHSIFTALVDELGYCFTGNEDIRNKEAIVVLADTYHILPSDVMSFFRFIIYKATGQTLLIKNNMVINEIKHSNFNPAPLFNQFGLEKLAEIFNRFKPLFLAFKSVCPKTINKISKLSKTCHKPLSINPLNHVTSMLLTKKDTHWLENATPFALFKAMSACYARINGQNAFVYRVRNGKSFVKMNNSKNVVWDNYYFLEEYMKTRFDLTNKAFYLPDDVEFALPTSEKMFVGNIPTGTKFYGETMAVGVFWQNSWGARDIDVSGLNIGGKIGWNSAFNQGNGNLMYSGDITNAPNGAVEYLYANNGLTVPTLVSSNVFSGQNNCTYKIIVGKGDEVRYDYMMNPDNRMAEMECQSVQHQTVLGLFLPNGKKQCFVALNFGAGEARVSGNSELSTMATQALYQQWSNALMFNDIIETLGGTVTKYPSEADYDLSLKTLTKESLIKPFTENERKK